MGERLAIVRTLYLLRTCPGCKCTKNSRHCARYILRAMNKGRRFVNEWLFPQEDKRLLNITTLLSVFVILLTSLIFLLSSAISSNQVARNDIGRILDAYVSKNDIINQFFIRGDGVERSLLQQWAYYFTILRDGWADPNSTNKVTTVEAHDQLLATSPGLVDLRNEERVFLENKINRYQLWQNLLFYISILLQVLNTVNLFRLTKRTLPLSPNVDTVEGLNESDPVKLI